TPLICGKTAWLTDEGQAGLEDLKDFLFNTDKNFVFKITPSHLDYVASLSPESSCECAHVLVVGGEQFTSRTLAPWLVRMLPNAIFYNEYGPTETVVGCAFFRADQSNAKHLFTKTNIPIGKPISSTHFYVL